MPAKRRCLLFATALCLTIVTACGGAVADPPDDGGDDGGGGGGGGTEPAALVITSVTPTAGTATDLWPTVRVTFGAPLNQASVTSSSVTLSRDGASLPSTLTLSPDATALTVSAAMLPGAQYTLALTPALKSAAGGSLATTATTFFSPREVRGIDVVPQFPFLRQWLSLDAQGTRHLLTIDPTRGIASYSRCAAGADCSVASAWQTANLETGSTPIENSGSIAVDRQGRVHITYYIQSLTNLRYATCASGCTTAANWAFADIDTGAKPGMWSAIRADAAGVLHVVYSDWSAGGLRYATCSTSCATAANWTSVALPSTLGDVQDIALAATNAGTLTTIYRGQGGGGYPVQVATCAAACTTTESWQTATLLTAGLPPRGTDLAVDANGALHAVYWAGSSTTYATCATNCGQAPSWQQVVIHSQDGTIVPGIAVHAERLAVVSASDDGSLLLATCMVSCTLAAHWQTKVISTAAFGGWHPQVAFTDDGQPVIVTATSGVQYLE